MAVLSSFCFTETASAWLPGLGKAFCSVKIAVNSSKHPTLSNQCSESRELLSFRPRPQVLQRKGSGEGVKNGENVKGYIFPDFQGLGR